MALRPVMETLARLRGGEFLDAIAEQLAAVVSGVDLTGKTGTITIKLTIAKATRGGAMVVRDKITATVPTDPPLEAMFFATPEGNLLPEDPRQAKLDLRVAAVPDSGPLKRAAASE